MMRKNKKTNGMIRAIIMIALFIIVVLRMLDFIGIDVLIV